MLKLLSSGLALLVSTTSALKLVTVEPPNPSANMTQVHWGTCDNGSKLNYDDSSNTYMGVAGCGQYAMNHASWCESDGGWGNENCCRCQDDWEPTYPEHYGYWEYHFGNNATNGTNGTFWGNDTNGSGPCSTWANMTWANMTMENCTEGNITWDLPEAGGPCSTWANMTWANMTMENCTEAGVNQTQLDWGTCSGGRIGYDDPDRLNQEGYGCGYLAEQHGSWCSHDDGWGYDNCCRCEEGWTPSHPGQYGYFELFGADCNDFGNCTNATTGPGSMPNNTFGGNDWPCSTWANMTWANMTMENCTEGWTPSAGSFDGTGSDINDPCWTTNTCNLNSNSPPAGFFDGTGSHPSDPCWTTNTCMPNWTPPTGNFDGTGSDINDPCWQTSTCTPNWTPPTGNFDGTGSDINDPCWQTSTCSPAGTPSTTMPSGNTSQCHDNSSPADKYGDGCDKYVYNRNWCSGQYDTSSF